MPNYGPGSPGFIQSATDATSQATQGDVQGIPGTPSHTVFHIGGNNSTSTFLANNVVCPASVQTVITSVTLNPGLWDIYACCAASVNSVYKNGDSEIALIPSGGAQSAAYAAGALGGDIAITEASGDVSALVNLTATTTVQLVGYNVGGGANSTRFTALATTTAGFANATGIIAQPTV